MNTITQFASEVAATVLGVEKSFTDGCCGVITEEQLQPDQIEAGSTIMLIIEAIMAIIEACDDKQSFQRHVSKQTLFGKTYFRWKTRTLPKQTFRGAEVDRRQLIDTILYAASTKPDTVVSAVWDDVKQPTWSII